MMATAFGLPSLWSWAAQLASKCSLARQCSRALAQRLAVTWMKIHRSGVPVQMQMCRKRTRSGFPSPYLLPSIATMAQTDLLAVCSAESSQFNTPANLLSMVNTMFHCKSHLQLVRSVWAMIDICEQILGIPGQDMRSSLFENRVGYIG